MMPLAVENGLSFKANHLLFRTGIPASKSAIQRGLQSGALRPGKCPVNYGKQTHTELCRWVGLMKLVIVGDTFRAIFDLLLVASAENYAYGK
jgi:hypothetical protein